MHLRIASALVSLAMIAATVVSQPKPPGDADRLVLRDGTVITGRIVGETTHSVTLSFLFGGRVEFRKRDLAQFDRGPGAAPGGEHPPAPATPVAPDRIEERFLVYLGDRPVGYRSVVRARTTRRGATGVLHREEVTFPGRREAKESTREAERTCRVVTLEFTPDGAGPRTLYYREVGMGTDYIIDATLRGERLEYTWLRGGKRTFHREEVPANLRFPISAWFEMAASARAAEEISDVIPVFDPHLRSVRSARMQRFTKRRVPVGATGFSVTPVVSEGVRGKRLRWLTAEGRTLKEHLNGISLVAVATVLQSIPKDPSESPRRDAREAKFVRVRLDPVSGLVIRAPGAAWVHAAAPVPGASLTLLNREMETSISVYWSEDRTKWPGPAAPSGAAIKPVGFGGWPGQGWHVRGASDRECVVRRMETAAGRIAAVLDTPREFASVAMIDFSALLRGTHVPGAGPPSPAR